MASPLPSVRSNEIAWGGATLMSIGCNSTAWAASAVEALARLASGPMYVEKAFLRIRVMPTHATATISVGNQSSATANLNAYNCQNLPAGLYDLTDVTWASKIITPGDLIVVTFGAASAVGSAALELVLRPGS